MANGGKIDYYLDRQSKGYPTPLDTRPEPDPESLLFIRAYNTLSRFRPPSMSGVAAINLESIITYHERVFQIGDLDEFIDIMSALDHQFILDKTPPQNTKSRK